MKNLFQLLLLVVFVCFQLISVNLHANINKPNTSSDLEGDFNSFSSPIQLYDNEWPESINSSLLKSYLSTNVLVRLINLIDYTSYQQYSNSLWLANGSKTYYNDGFVGINTNNPIERLHVNGTMLALEINVEANNAPDYVFADDYDLLSLHDLEKFINENQHLPEVPSAEAMANEGLNVSEMNLLILKKVEELTLHMINHDERIDDLTKEYSDNLQTLEELSHE